MQGVVSSDSATKAQIPSCADQQVWILSVGKLQWEQFASVNRMLMPLPLTLLSKSVGCGSQIQRRKVSGRGEGSITGVSLTYRMLQPEANTLHETQPLLPH